MLPQDRDCCLLLVGDRNSDPCLHARRYETIVTLNCFCWVRQVTAVKKDVEDLKLETRPEDVLAEATRKAAVSFIVKRLQVHIPCSD